MIQAIMICTSKALAGLQSQQSQHEQPWRPMTGKQAPNRSKQVVGSRLACVWKLVQPFVRLKDHKCRNKRCPGAAGNPC